MPDNAQQEPTGLFLDGVAASEHVDKSGEIFEVAGADISSLPKTGFLNYEHKDQNNGGSFVSLVGRCVKAKKIFEKKDCENARERMYWEALEVPFVYVIVRLFGDDHPNAAAAAAIMRDQARHDEDQILRFSIEGTTVERKGNRLVRTLCRHIALTKAPCNDTAVSNILYDPKNPKSSEASEESLAGFLEMSKFESIDRQKLSSVPFRYVPFDAPEAQLAQALGSLRKAYMGVPGGQVGNDALATEDLASEVQKGQVKAVLRDYNPHRHGDFRAYAKASLPEASESFLDYYADLVGKLSKEGKLQFLAKKESPDGDADLDEAAADTAQARKDREKKYKAKIASIKEAHAAGDPDAPALPPAEQFQIAKRKVGRGESYFDEDKGVLYLGRPGPNSPIPKPLKLYTPDPDDNEYDRILHDPEINAVHDKALDNWMALHKLARSGKLPPDVIAHAALFSAMSPNTAVPLQELAYAHIQDLMAQGLDPTKQNDPEEMERWGREFVALSKGRRLPEWHRDHFADKSSGVWTNDGRIKVIGLERQKWGGVENYHALHSALAEMMQRHGADARAISSEANGRKAEDLLARGREKGAAKRAGGATESRPTFGQGFAPKTLRYLLGMSGLGNVVVPDTHFLRHTFGLMTSDPRTAALKAGVLRAKDDPILQGIDRYYYKNHPAVQWTREKIKQRYGEDVGEHATFPGFWMHWLTIAPHERQRGWPTMAANESTDHAVYFQSVKRVLDRYGIPYDRNLLKAEPPASDAANAPQASEPFAAGASIPARVAMATKELEEHYGETPAAFAYYAFMVPALLSHSSLSKAEKLGFLLRKAAELPPMPSFDNPLKKQPTPRSFGNKTVIPGEVEWLKGPQSGQKHELVHSDAKTGNVIIGEDGSHRRIDPGLEGVSYRINSRPAPHPGNHLLDATRHGLPNLAHSPRQQALVNGIDMQSLSAPAEMHGATAESGGTAAWGKSAAGKVGWVKSSGQMENLFGGVNFKDFSTAQREAAVHHLADNVFGLGEHVPVTAAFQHPVTGEHHSVQEQVADAEHFQSKDLNHAAALHHMFRSGQLDKLALMDMVLGNVDRHDGNYLVTPGKGAGVHLIDNGLAFMPQRHGEVATVPHYWHKAGVLAHGDMKDEVLGQRAWMNTPLHPEAVNWVKQLDPQKFADEMNRVGVPQRLQGEALQRLNALKTRVAVNPNISRVGAYYSPLTGPGEKQPSDYVLAGQSHFFDAAPANDDNVDDAFDRAFGGGTADAEVPKTGTATHDDLVNPKKWAKEFGIQ